MGWQPAWICTAGCVIHLEGWKLLFKVKSRKIESFIDSLTTEAPPLARIDSIHVRGESPNTEYTKFDIRPSTAIDGVYQPISADVAICPDCEHELFDPNNKRYLYPFINCTNCGPRFTIIKDIPYDRPKTTMADFPMCNDCRAEYQNPLDRRFHAQPIACPECGPFVELRGARSESLALNSKISSIEYRTSAILKTRRLLREGYIIAIKGLGGFHLACDASNLLAVEELRHRKGRVDKPLRSWPRIWKQ